MDVININTDGSCSGNPGPGGWAAIVQLENEKIIACGLDEDTTNNRMELKGFIAGLEMAINAKLENPSAVINIYTDSKYVENPINLKWIDKWIINGFKDIKNVDLWVQIADILNVMNNINVIWVEREKNKFADKIAREARDGMYGKRATIIA